MKVIEPGHIYETDYIDGEEHQKGKVVCVNREGVNNHAGTQTQELIRVAIDRTMHCDNCLPDHMDDGIIYHLRMALILHEARALIRKVEKNLLEPENIFVGTDGHFALTCSDQTEDNKNWVGRIGERKAIRDLLEKHDSEKLHGIPGEAQHPTNQLGSGKD